MLQYLFYVDQVGLSLSPIVSKTDTLAKVTFGSETAEGGEGGEGVAAVKRSYVRSGATKMCPIRVAR